MPSILKKSVAVFFVIGFISSVMIGCGGGGDSGPLGPQYTLENPNPEWVGNGWNFKDGSWESKLPQNVLFCGMKYYEDGTVKIMLFVRQGNAIISFDGKRREAVNSDWDWGSKTSPVALESLTDIFPGWNFSGQGRTGGGAWVWIIPLSKLGGAPPDVPSDPDKLRLTNKSWQARHFSVGMSWGQISVKIDNGNRVAKIKFYDMKQDAQGQYGEFRVQKRDIPVSAGWDKSSKSAPFDVNLEFPDMVFGRQFCPDDNDDIWAVEVIEF